MSNINSKIKTFAGLAALLFGLGFSSMAVAQVSDASLPTIVHTSYTIGYYTVGSSDAQLHVLNPGSTGGFGNANEAQTAPAQGGDLCANIYVFNVGQQMIACCSCKISPNGMQGFSLATDLLGNPLTGPDASTTAGAIEIVSSRGGGVAAGLPGSEPVGPVTTSDSYGRACDAGTFYPVGGALDSSITHVHSVSAGSAAVAVTESEFDSAPLNETEYVNLVQQCYAIEAPPSKGGIGSGAGLCTCDPANAR